MYTTRLTVLILTLENIEYYPFLVKKELKIQGTSPYSFTYGTYYITTPNNYQKKRIEFSSLNSLGLYIQGTQIQHIQ